MATAVPFGPLALSIEDLPGPAAILEGPDGRVGAYNVAFATWAGRDDLLGVPLAELVPGDPAAPRLWHEARACGTAEHHVERRGPAGEPSFWCLRARRTPAGVLVCAADLTAMADAARAMHATERDYVAVAAHELRAPLSAIKAWASALEARGGAAASRAPGAASGEADGLGAIVRQVDRMNDLLTDLFDAARAGTGLLVADRAPVEVAAIVRRAATSGPWAGRVRVDASRSGAAFADAAQIEAVLARVLAFVAARQPAGPIAVAVEPRGRELHVAIRDAGPELTRRAEAALFARALRSRERHGLGLYLCQQIAAANGGRMFRDHTPEGARFVLVLAAPPGDDGAAPMHVARRAAASARVLVADPDVARRSRALAALRLEGHQVDGVGDAAGLLEGLDDMAPDLVVVDASLAGASGLATIERVLAHPAEPRVIALAPSAERPEALDGAERAGVLAVLGRPLDWPHLVSLIACAAGAR